MDHVAIGVFKSRDLLSSCCSMTRNGMILLPWNVSYTGNNRRILSHFRQFKWR